MRNLRPSNLQSNFTQPELEYFIRFNDTSHGSLVGEGGGSNSHSHGDSNFPPQTQYLTSFDEFREKHLSKCHEFDSSSHHETLTVGSVVDEQAQLVYSDFMGIKRSKWFPRHQISVRRRSIQRMGSSLMFINHRDLVCDLFLLPDNVIVREVVEVVEL